MFLWSFQSGPRLNLRPTSWPQPVWMLAPPATPSVTKEPLNPVTGTCGSFWPTRRSTPTVNSQRPRLESTATAPDQTAVRPQGPRWNPSRPASEEKGRSLVTMTVLASAARTSCSSTPSQCRSNCPPVAPVRWWGTATFSRPHTASTMARTTSKERRGSELGS